MHTVEQSEKLSAWLDLSRSCGWWEPFKGVVVACERPLIQAVNERGQLHRDGGPALLCRDGWPVYALNGVRMTEDQVMTPAEKLDPAKILAETNTEVRRELIRKMGVELLLSHLPHRVLDKRGDYEVLSVDFPQLIQDARFLKMVNPSVGCYHMEGIERECDTVEKAINWRAGAILPQGENWEPAQLT